MIREANHSDLFDVLKLAREFNKENKSFNVSCDESLERAITKIINESFTFKTWVIESNGEVVSVLSVKISECFFSEERVVEEVGWFSTKEARGSLENVLLIKEVEKYAELIGADKIQMTTLFESNISLDKFIKYFNSIGYKPVQVHYSEKI